MARKKRKTPPRYKSGPKKGQFKPSKKSSKRRSASTKRKSPMAKRRRRRGGSKKRRSYKGPSFKKQATDLMVGGAAYGYIMERVPQASAMAAKVPTLVNRDISNGLVLYIANKHVIKNKYVKNMALAALVRGATSFGAGGFSLDGYSSMAGWDDAIDVTDEGEELSGVMD